MLEQLIPLIAGAGGGAAGGNILGSLVKGGGRGSNTMVGMVAGVVCTYLFGDTLGPIVASMVGSGMLEQILGGLLTGAGGGGVATILWNVVRSMMGGR